MKLSAIGCSSLFILMLATMPALAQSDCAAPSTDTEANIKLIESFEQTVFRGGEIDRIGEFLTEGYIQHNPNLKSGRDTLAEALRSRAQFAPSADAPAMPVMSPVATVAENDLVVFIKEQKQPRPDNPNETYSLFSFDMYRVCDGLIAEHWDSMELLAPASTP
jgi:predicted SnoaL-like aldol condensation-catalyzing enzyme